MPKSMKVSLSEKEVEAIIWAITVASIKGSRIGEMDDALESAYNKLKVNGITLGESDRPLNFSKDSKK